MLALVGRPALSSAFIWKISSPALPTLICTIFYPSTAKNATLFEQGTRKGDIYVAQARKQNVPKQTTSAEVDRDLGSGLDDFEIVVDNDSHNYYNGRYNYDHDDAGNSEQRKDDDNDFDDDDDDDDDDDNDFDDDGDDDDDDDDDDDETNYRPRLFHQQV